MITASHIETALKAAGAGTGLVMPAEDIAQAFNDAILNYGKGLFKTTETVAALLSENMMESAYFRTTEEYRKDGRYAPYIGRTFMQITWHLNYSKFGAWCYEKGLVADPEWFVDDPKRLAELQWAALGGVWYFTEVMFHGKPLTAYCNNIDQVGKAVNLGDPFHKAVPNGHKARVAAYAAVRALGSKIVPKPTPISKEPSMIKSPVPGARVSLAFGVRREHYRAGFHTGRDYAANTGAPVYAVRRGVFVRMPFDADGYGNWGILRADNGRDYLYCHLSAFTKTGVVRAGDQIGRVGATGNVTGPHLHFEDRPRGGGYGQVRNPDWNYVAPKVGYPKPKTKIVYDSLVRPGQRNSDSVYWVQVALNEVSLKGGRELKLTGDYGTATMNEVKKFQIQKCGDVGDGDLGPKQIRQLFKMARVRVTHKEKP